MSQAPDESMESPLELRFPRTVLIAGIVWIVFGGILLVVFLAFVFDKFLGHHRRAHRVEFETVIASLLLATIGAVFIRMGVRSVRGTASDSLGYGSVSAVFGFLYIGCGLLIAEGAEYMAAAGGLFLGSSLLTAGILAIVGRSAYKAWREKKSAL
jgi:tellurite resistance protein TehA-like permease